MSLFLRLLNVVFIPPCYGSYSIPTIKKKPNVFRLYMASFHSGVLFLFISIYEHNTPIFINMLNALFLI